MVHVIILLEPNEDGRFVYYPGQYLKGTAELSLGEVKKIRAFYIKVFGRAIAHWEETESRTVQVENRNTENNDDRRTETRTETRTVYYEGVEIFINTKTFLFGHKGGPTLEIQPGTHRYTFAVQLPVQLPYTMGAECGNIEYFIEAKLDIPWSFDKEFRTPFTVVRYDDLNMYPELALAQKFEEFKTFCCFLCKSGTLLMTVSIPHTGFATGQAVPVRIDYSNQSNINVERTHVILNRTITFTSHTPYHKTRWNTEKMIETYAEGVKGNDKNSMEAILTIPGILMNSNERFCEVIKVSYAIQVIGVVKGCHTSPKIDFPITIGSVAIGQQYQGPIIAPPQTMDQQFPTMTSPMMNQQYQAPPMINQQYQAPPMMMGQQFPTSPMAVPPMMGPPTMAPQMMPPAIPTMNQYNSDLPPTFDQAVKPQNPDFMQQPAQNFMGWGVTQPSAPPS